MTKLIECLKGPTTTYVLGTDYVFAPDAMGRAVCLVHDERHQEIFLAVQRIYREAPPLDAPKEPPAPPPDDGGPAPAGLGQGAHTNALAPKGGAPATPTSPPASQENKPVTSEAGAIDKLGLEVVDEIEPAAEPTAPPPFLSSPLEAGAIDKLGLEVVDEIEPAAEPTAPVAADSDAGSGAAGASKDPLDHDGDERKGGAAPATGQKATGWAAMTNAELRGFAKANNVALGAARSNAGIIALLETAGLTPPNKE